MSYKHSSRKADSYMAANHVYLFHNFMFIFKRIIWLIKRKTLKAI